VRVLVTGAHGQLGRALLATAPQGVEAVGLDRSALDIVDPAAVAATVAELAPDAIINAAAYTAVDAAEREPESANRVNGLGPENLAQVAAARGLRLIHVSTDFVFDGERGTPYTPDAPTAPLGVYGASKLVGERAVAAVCPSALTVRTAWVYSAEGRNFLLTILKLLAERDEVRVVADQVGTPTAVRPLARTLWAAVSRAEVNGILHWTDAGVASWYDFAVAIAEEAVAVGLLARSGQVVPIRTADYPTPARRPCYSVLDKTATIPALAVAPRHWRIELRAMLREMVSA
jgi:dTDP-4-dehydrorhamnose reductase